MTQTNNELSKWATEKTIKSKKLYHDSSVLGLDFPNRGFVVFDRQLEEQGKNKSAVCIWGFQREKMGERVCLCVCVCVCLLESGGATLYVSREMREKGISIKMKGSGRGRWEMAQGGVLCIYIYE